MPEIDIHERYDNFDPPFDVPHTVRRLLTIVPEQYLIGLKSIVLTNVDALPRRRRRQQSRARGHKVPTNRARGYYHQEWKGESAHVELLVDNTCKTWGRLIRWSVIQHMTVGDVLFHEIGHHIHTVHTPEHREREDVADEWGERFSMRYFRRHYWYLVPLALASRFVMRVVRIVRPNIGKA